MEFLCYISSTVHESYFLFFDANRLSILLLEAVGILFTLICFFSFMFLISSKVYPSSFLRVDAAMKDQQKCSSNQEMAFLIINPFIVASIFWRSSLLLRFVISNPLLFSVNQPKDSEVNHEIPCHESYFLLHEC